MIRSRRPEIAHWLVALTVLFGAHTAWAWPLSRVHFRGEVGGAAMLPEAQRNAGFGVGLQMRGGLVWELNPSVGLQLAWSGLYFPRDGGTGRPGVAWGPLIGIRWDPVVLGRVVVSLDANAGLQASGNVHFACDGGLGAAVSVAPWAAVGVVGRMGLLLGTGGETSAIYASVGLSLALGPQHHDQSSRGADPSVADRDQDGVPDAQDQCIDASYGRTEDPFKRGCPRDSDHDSVPDEHDRCPEVPGEVYPTEGNSPAEHLGCPAASDFDRDGVPDERDGCRQVPAGNQPDPSRPGCPLVAVPARAPDQDDDSVADAQDQCQDLHETFNGVDDEDGCPDGRRLARLEGDHIRLSGIIRFEPNESAPVTTDQDTTRTLRGLAALLDARRDLGAVEVRVHPDGASADQALNDQRAAHMVAWLTCAHPRTNSDDAHCVSGARLRSRGVSTAMPRGMAGSVEIAIVQP